MCTYILCLSKKLKIKMILNNKKRDIKKRFCKKELLITFSVVFFKDNLDILKKNIKSIIINSEDFKFNYKIYIINNSYEYINLNKYFKSKNIEIINNENIGFGLSHNKVLNKLGRYHVIVNPDLIFHKDSVRNAIKFFERNHRVGAITPSFYWENKNRQYLIKSYPSLSVLFLRAIYSLFKIRLFNDYLNKYEMKNMNYEIRNDHIKLISGACIFLRGKIFKKINGFDKSYFLYFEDFDLSIRLRKFTSISYVPTIRITHYGGHTAKKGLKHIIYFLSSMIIFFKKYGIKVY